MKTIYEEHISALEFYRDTIPIWWKEKSKFGVVVPHNFSDHKFSDLQVNQQICHCLWMMEEMLRIDKKEKSNVAIDKVARWIGFVQGVLIVHGFTEIQDERERTRPWFKKDTEIAA